MLLFPIIRTDRAGGASRTAPVMVTSVEEGRNTPIAISKRATVTLMKKK